MECRVAEAQIQTEIRVWFTINNLKLKNDGVSTQLDIDATRIPPEATFSNVNQIINLAISNLPLCLIWMAEFIHFSQQNGKF